MRGMTKRTSLIQPVILCGGSGTRLWPVSRDGFPKQFLNLVSDQSMFQETCAAFMGRAAYNDPLVLTNEKFRFLVQRQLTELGLGNAKIILEPHSRNTAPAITLAALVMAESDPDAVMLVLPSDHVIGDEEAFHRTIERAVKCARQDNLATFGIPALTPETGYGYVRKGRKIEGADQAYRVESFVEKPDRATAENYVDSGDYFWNSGMFAFTARRFLEEMRKRDNKVISFCNAALSKGRREGNVFLPNSSIFEPVENISIDYAVMEHTKKAVVVEAEFDWNDCKDCYVRSENRLVATLGLNNLVVVETNDVVLVADKERAQDIKTIVDELKVKKREEAVAHKKIHRPWGTCESLHIGETHQVKHIVVYPGQKLSLQYHHHRSEHWTIVSGIAQITLGDTVKTICANESIYIPVDSPHRMYNPGTEPIHFIEVQYGDYLGEDDIVRIEDDYGRIAEATEGHSIADIPAYVPVAAE